MRFKSYIFINLIHYKVNGLYVSNVYSGVAETNQHPRRDDFAKAVDGFKHLTIFTSSSPLDL